MKQETTELEKDFDAKFCDLFPTGGEEHVKEWVAAEKKKSFEEGKELGYAESEGNYHFEDAEKECIKQTRKETIREALKVVDNKIDKWMKIYEEYVTKPKSTLSDDAAGAIAVAKEILEGIQALHTDKE
jgi:hypothetical protein